MHSPLDVAKQKLIEISIALSSETDLCTLLKKIVSELRVLTNADGGSLFLAENGNLRFEVAQNNTLRRSKGDDFQFFKPFEIPISERSIAGYVALTGNTLNIPDVYKLSAELPYQFNPAFDLRNNYRTQSILAIPLKDHTGRIIGVLELINALDPTEKSIPFNEAHENLVLSLASLAAVAINKARLIQTSQELFEKLEVRTLALEKANQEMRQEIAERRRVEKALVESESRFRTIIREAAIGIALIDKTGRVIEGNPALLAMLGYAKEELRGMEFTRINHPENANLILTNFQKLLTGNHEVCKVETRYIRKDGWIGWGRQCISLVRGAEGKPQFVIALFEDITDRRESEEKIRTYQAQLQSLASELSVTEERERRHLATVLHDHIAQLLVVAKGKFEQMQESALFRIVAEPMEEIRRLIEESIRYTRALIFELSPPILYELGFEPAIEWLGEHFEKQYGLVVEVEDDNLPKPLDNEDRVLLFRAVRELLFNVLKHARADSAKVCMHRDGDQLQVIVEDNGVGFAPDKLAAPTGKIEGFGLFSIRERLNYFGGTMEIESTPGKLTRVILTTDLQPSKQKRTGHQATPTSVRVASSAGRREVFIPVAAKRPAPLQ
jgi:PAS domain S-box-containing protein